MSNSERVGLLTPDATGLKERKSSSVDSWNGRGHLPEVVRESDVTAATVAVAPAVDEPLGGGGTAELWHRGLDWPVVIWIGLVHVIALGAPFYFSWQGVLVCAALIFMTGAGGVCMGYHPCLTHGSFKTFRPVRWLLAILGGLSGQASALTLGEDYRKHQPFSDHDRDPPSPRA